MFYSFDTFMAPDLFQSWCATIRDQSTVQLIASTALRQQVRHDLENAVETSVEFAEHALELPFAAQVLVEEQKTQNAAKGRRRGAKGPVHH